MITNRTIDLATIARHTGWRLGFITAYATAVEVYQAVTDDGLHLPVAIPAMLGTALSILLGFKTQASYDRWWEARKLWGSIVNDSRTFARQVLTFVSPRDASDAGLVDALRRTLVLRQAAWTLVLSRFLRGEAIRDRLETFLHPDEIERISAVRTPTNALLQRQGEELRAALDAGRIDQFRFLSIDATLARLTDHMGACERIRNTVFPAHYGHMVSNIVWLFALLLPWGLVESMGWICIPVTVTATVVFWLIEEIGYALVDPFAGRATDTSMTALSRGIEIDLLQMLGDTEVPPALQPVDGVLM
ncbi:MAG: bestrophin family ion channel [Planctomycetota bacterium]